MSSCSSNLATRALQPKLRARVHVDALMCFLPLQRLRKWGAPYTMNLPSSPGCIHRLSQPLDAFLPPRPFRTYFIPITFLGFYPSKAFPHRLPNTSRLVVTLMTLSPKRQPSGLLAASESVLTPNRQLRRVKRPILSWALSSPGFPSTCDHPRFTRGVPSCAFSNACPKTFIRRHFRV